MFAEEGLRAIIISRYVLDTSNSSHYTHKPNDYPRFQSIEHLPPNGAWKQIS